MKPEVRVGLAARGAATPLLLGSWWGLLPGVLMVIAMQATCWYIANKNGWGHLIRIDPVTLQATTTQLTGTEANVVGLTVTRTGLLATTFRNTLPASSCWPSAKRL